MSTGIRRAFAAFVFCAFGSANAIAAAPDVTITDAKIEGGKLVVTGTTATARMKVKLDGQFDATSDGKKAFTFSEVYAPPDCIVNVGKAGAATTTPAVVADCARGFNPLGAWNAATDYVTDDVVTQLGSVWRALKANRNKSPSANASFWEKFVSKGDPGVAGPAGATGPRGLTGAQGIQGETGAQGLKGDTGATGATGATGIVSVTSLDSATGALVFITTTY